MSEISVHGLIFTTGNPLEFTKVGKKSIIEYVINAFDNNLLIDDIFVVCPTEYADMVLSIPCLKRKKIIPSDVSGLSHLFIGLKNMESLKTDIVVINDASHPMISDDIISRVIFSALEKGSGVAYNLVSDIPVAEGKLVSLEDTGNVKYPQAFKYHDIMKTEKHYDYHDYQNLFDFMRYDVELEFVEEKYPDVMIQNKESLEYFKFWVIGKEYTMKHLADKKNYV